MDPSIRPAGPPPPGVLSNFVDPVNHGSNLVACNIIMLVISIIVVSLRILSRTVLTDWRLGWDDIFMVVALIGTTVFGSFIVVTTHYGLGRHIWDVPMDVYTPHYLWWIMATCAGCPISYFFIKISILLFYLRVFQLQGAKRYMVYALMAYCTTYYWVGFSTVIGICNAMNKEWDITVTMNCFSYGKLVFAINSLDLVADAMLLAFPIPMVMKLRITSAQRIYLLVIFSAGLSASIVCAVRIALSVQQRGNTDATMAQYHIVMLFCIEHYLAVIAACMPTLGPFFHWLRPSHWKHENLEHSPHRDIEGFQRVWPRKQKKSVDDSLMNDTLVEEPTDKSFTLASYDIKLPHGRQQTDWAKGDTYGLENSVECVHVVERPSTEKEDLK